MGVLPLGSDFPVEGINPLLGFYAAVTRLSVNGESPHGADGWYAKEKLTRAQALKGMTYDAAYASFMEDDIGRRKKGTLNWGGAANTFWTIDRDADLALTFGTQVIPPGDRKVGKMITQVEVGMYELAGVKV